MQKFIISIICFFIPFLILSQNERHIKKLFKPIKNKVWNKYEMKLSAEKKIYWLNIYLQKVSVDSMRSSILTLNDVPSDIHFIDLNHDTLPDIVDNTTLGIAPVLIYLNKKDSFKQLINENESLFKDLTYFKNKTEVVTYTQGMVVPYIGESVYELVNDSIVLIKTRTSLRCMNQPNRYFKHPLSIQTIFNDAPLRERPEIAPAICIIDDGEGEFNSKNNILMRLPVQSKGKVWGQHRDRHGQKWLFVEILTDKSLIGKNFQVGWIKAEDIEVVSANK